MKVYFDSVGCRLNQAEIELMAAQLRAAGYGIAESVEDADLVIINSCAVTAAAASDSRQKVRQAYRAGAPEIILTGCLATLEPGAAMELPGITKVITNDEKAKIPSLLSGLPEIYDLEPIVRKPLPGIHKRTRAFIKAQDGCNNYCTYCITRIARGPSVSIDQKIIADEIRAAEAGGAHEAVLTGVNLGAWGRDLPEKRNLAWLVRYLLNETSIERIRLSSTEPWDLDEEFFTLWQDKRMCRHLHLPLQSGSAGVLHRMVRNTTPEKFCSLVETARRMISGLAVTTDIIVGFPGETEKEFEESLEFVKKIGFAGGHVFRFSAREGTAAARLPGRLHGSITIERSKRMRSVLEEDAQRFARNFIGKELAVLWETSQQESNGRWLLHGLSDNYLQFQSTSTEDRSNCIDWVVGTIYSNGIITV